MESQDDFEEWLMFMDDRIRQLLSDLPAEVSRSLDFTPDSLVILEKWLLSKYPTVKSILKSSENWILDGLARYVGETNRNSAGGKWAIELENPKYAFYRLPEIRQKNGSADCPVTFVTAALDRRNGSYMKMILEHMIADSH